MKLGVFGGTFDPVHVGHLIAAMELCDQLELDRLLLVPASIPPHKRHRAITSSALRVEMLRAAVGDDPRFEVCDIELRRGGPSFTVDTLRELRESHPGARFVLAIGADQLADFHTWRSPAEIRRLAALAAFVRPGSPWPRNAPADVVRVEIPAMDISSSDIRRRVSEGRPIRHFLAPAVFEIVMREGLYR